jgi:hypothetical protein
LTVGIRRVNIARSGRIRLTRITATFVAVCSLFVGFLAAAPANAALGHGNISLTQPKVGRIAGTALTTAGSPVTGICAYAVPAGHRNVSVPAGWSRDTHRFWDRAALAANGTYDIAGLAPGHYAVAFAACPGGGDPWSVAFAPNAPSSRAPGKIYAVVRGSVTTVNDSNFPPIPAPAVSALSAEWGPSTGGTRVTITGSNLADAVAVHFGAAVARVVANSGTAVTVVAPAGRGTVDVTVTTPGGTSPVVPSDQFGYLSVSASATGRIYPGRSSTVSLGKYSLTVPAGVVSAPTTATIYQLAADPDDQAGLGADFQINGDWENGAKTVSVTLPIDPDLATLGTGWAPVVEHYQSPTDPDIYTGANLSVDQADATVTVNTDSLSPFISTSLPQSILSSVTSTIGTILKFQIFIQNQLRAFLGVQATPPSCNPSLNAQNGVQTTGSAFSVSPALGVPGILYCVQPSTLPDGTPAAQWTLTNNTGAVLQVTSESSGPPITTLPSGDAGTDIFMGLLNQVQPAGSVLIPPTGSAVVTVPQHQTVQLDISPGPAINTADVFLIREAANLLVGVPKIATSAWAVFDNCVYNIGVVNGWSRAALSTCFNALVSAVETGVRRNPVIGVASLLLDALVTIQDQISLYLQSSSLDFDGTLSYQPNNLMITTTDLNAADDGQPYTFDLTATEPNINPNSFTWTASGLPDGLSMATDGEIGGTTQVSPGTFNVDITVTDQSGQTDETTLPLTVENLPPTPSQPAPPQAPFPSCATCATSWGDPHVVTFDSAYYNFQQVGEFVLTKSDLNDFQIQVRQAPFGGTSQTVAANVAVAFEVAGHRVGIYLANPGVTTRVDGAVVTLSAGTYPLPGGGYILDSPSTDQEAVFWPDGSFASVNYAGVVYLTLAVSVAADQAGHLSGLLGNDDGNPQNDFTTSSGVVLPDPPSTAQLYGEFSNSWRITQAESLFDYGTGQTTATFTDLNFPYGLDSTSTLPPAVAAAAAALCQAAGVTAEPYLDNCILDVALTGDASAASAAATVQSFEGATTGTQSITLASGDGTVGSADPNVTVEDSCAGATTQATIVAPYPGAWTQPITGTQWDSVNADYDGCNETFTTTFTLPADAVDPSITVTDLADNSADVSVNGNQPFITGNVSGVCEEDFSGAPSSGSTTTGLKAGVNTLTFDVDNCYPAAGESPTGIDFSATVTYNTSGS